MPKLLLFFLLAIPVCFLLAGCFNNWAFAILVTALYTMGSTGLIIIYMAGFIPGNPQTWAFLIIGIFLVGLAIAVLEILNLMEI